MGWRYSLGIAIAAALGHCCCRWSLDLPGPVLRGMLLAVDGLQIAGFVIDPDCMRLQMLLVLNFVLLMLLVLNFAAAGIQFSYWCW